MAEKDQPSSHSVFLRIVVNHTFLFSGIITSVTLSGSYVDYIYKKLARSSTPYVFYVEPALIKVAC